ncbi:MAG TPA: hypothetical protein VHG91_03230, partial [Longimicrobium sp.]|nr:hypothetical protein [Longimicrobium sp.]
ALERALEAAPLNRVMRDACERHLAWAALEDAGITADDDLPPPYEPLVRLFERGGAFHTEHGWAYVGHRGVPTRVKGWEHYHRPDPITALDDDALDALDAADAAR